MTPRRRILVTLLTVVACTAVAFVVGLLFGSQRFGFGQPGLLLLAIPAAAFGYQCRSIVLSSLAAPVFGCAGAVGICLSLGANGDGFAVATAVLTGLGGLVCVVAGVAAGHDSNLGKKKPD